MWRAWIGASLTHGGGRLRHLWLLETPVVVVTWDTVELQVAIVDGVINHMPCYMCTTVREVVIATLAPLKFGKL